MDKYFPFLLFILIGIGLTLFFWIIKRKENPSSTFGIENKLFLFIYLLIGATGLCSHLATFFPAEIAQKIMVPKLISISLISLFLISARLYGVQGGRMGRSVGKPVKFSERTMYLKVFLGYFIFWVLMDLFITAILNYPGQTLVQMSKDGIDRLGWQTASLMAVCWSLFGYETLKAEVRKKR